MDVQVKASARAEPGTLTPGSFPLMVPGSSPAKYDPVTMLVPVPSRGTVTISLALELRWANRGGSYDNDSLPARVTLPFRCTGDGELFQDRHGRIYVDWDHRWDLIIEIFTWKDGMMGWPVGTVRTPPDIRVLHILTMATLKRPYQVRHDRDWWDDYLTPPPGPNKGGWEVVVTNYDNVQHVLPRLPKPQRDRLLVGPMMIELVQPVSTLQGVFYQVFFAKDHFDIDLAQGPLLDTFISESLLKPYDVRIALESGMLPLRGEARASATYQGTPAQRIHYNKQLSEKRRAAVVGRLTGKGVPGVEWNEIKAIGDSQAT